MLPVALRRTLGIPLSETQKESLWRSLIGNWECADLDEARRLAGMGVPTHMRSEVWPVLVGAGDLMRKNPGAYQLLLQKDVPKDVLSAIRRDLARTFPGHEMFAGTTERGERGRTTMENVLRAYASIDPEVGYCQGINYLVGVLLMNMDEETAFWTFVAILKDPRYRLNGLFKEGLGRLIAFFGQHEHLLYRTLPLLYEHFHRQGVRTSMYASAWYTTVFAASLPLPVVFRIWDVFLLEGADVLLQVTMAVLQQCQEDLLKLRELESVQYLKSIPPQHLMPNKILREYAVGSLLNFKSSHAVQGFVPAHNKPRKGEKKHRDHGIVAGSPTAAGPSHPVAARRANISLDAPGARAHHGGDDANRSNSAAGTKHRHGAAAEAEEQQQQPHLNHDSSALGLNTTESTEDISTLSETYSQQDPGTPGAMAGFDDSADPAAMAETDEEQRLREKLEREIREARALDIGAGAPFNLDAEILADAREKQNRLLQKQQQQQQQQQEQQQQQQQQQQQHEGNHHSGATHDRHKQHHPHFHQHHLDSSLDEPETSRDPAPDADAEESPSEPAPVIIDNFFQQQ